MLGATPGLLHEVWELPGGRCPERLCGEGRSVLGQEESQGLPRPQWDGAPSPPQALSSSEGLGLCVAAPSTFSTNPGGAQREACRALPMSPAHPGPSPAPSSSQRSDGQVRPPAPTCPPCLCPQGNLAGWALALCSMGRGGQRRPDSRKGKNGETKASQHSQTTPLRPAQALGYPLVPSRSQNGQSPVGLGTWRGGRSASRRPLTALPPWAPAPAPAAPTWAQIRALPALGSAAGRLGGGHSGAGRSGGRAAWGREAGRGGDRFMRRRQVGRRRW